MKIKVITTWNNKLYKEYAYHFMKTYNWPFELKIYNEDVDFFEKVPECKAFVERNKHRMKYTNYQESNDDYRKDGVRFCYKVYAYTHAIMNEEADGLFWADSDSVFHKFIDDKWIEEHIHREDCMMTYVGRYTYLESGFLYFNLNHPSTIQCAKEMQEMYNKDLIYNEKEQHDAPIWDIVRKRFEEKGVKNYDIGDGGKGPAIERSILASVYYHGKGARKNQLGIVSKLAAKSTTAGKGRKGEYYKKLK